MPVDSLSFSPFSGRIGVPYTIIGGSLFPIPIPCPFSLDLDMGGVLASRDIIF